MRVLNTYLLGLLGGSVLSVVALHLEPEPIGRRKLRRLLVLLTLAWPLTLLVATLIAAAHLVAWLLDALLAPLGWRVDPLLAWYDAWVGLYWDRRQRRLYVLPLPMLGVVLRREDA